MGFELGGVSPRGAGLFLSSFANDAFFIGALVKGWGDVSHGLYCG
jgi:hypothetical protein